VVPSSKEDYPYIDVEVEERPWDEVYDHVYDLEIGESTER